MSTNYSEWRVLWSKISKMVVLGLPSLIDGDFNYIVGSHKKMGSKQYADSIDSRKFRRFISDFDLINLIYIRSRFTRCDNQLGLASVYERIDQALAIADWFQHYLGHKVQHLLRIAYDHCPILITTDGPYVPKALFRFENFWTFYPYLWNLIRKVWRMSIMRYRVT